jgi:hypothetical protein
METMALLLGTDIESRVHRHIRGRVARAGGTVNQLVNYRHCRVDDINLLDGGFGAVGKLSSELPARRFLSVARKTIKQEIKYWRHGPRISRDRRTFILDMHDAHQHPELRGRYDCAISSNLVEHSPNPIALLLNFHFITTPGGWQFHAIPHGAHTYDRFRKPTPVAHLIADFENNTGPADPTHVDDYRQSAVEKDGWQRDFHETHPLTYPFIHFHVFDEHNTRALLEFVFQEVVTDIIKTEQFSDNIVLFRNTLRPEFVEQYRARLTPFLT